MLKAVCRPTQTTVNAACPISSLVKGGRSNGLATVSRRAHGQVARILSISRVVTPNWHQRSFATPRHSLHTSRPVAASQQQRLSASADLQASRDRDAVVQLAHLLLQDDSPLSTRTALASIDTASAEYAAAAKEAAEEGRLASLWEEFKTIPGQVASAEKMLADPSTSSDEDMTSLVQDEIDVLLARHSELRQDLLEGLLPPPSSLLNSAPLGAILELRPQIGGDESAVFVAEMTRMYQRYVATHRPEWKFSTISINDEGNVNSATAYKEAIVQIAGVGAYEEFLFESGVHRVQRVPITTSVKKMQSSTMTIVVLPMTSESDSPSSASSSNANDLHIDPTTVRTETMRARGAGGQHVNRTESAIKLTHLPTGITVSMQDSRSQHENRARAWQILRARLLAKAIKEQEDFERSRRGEQLHGLTRGDRIRTYNFPQDRISDHRISGLNLSGLTEFMQGQSGASGGLETIVDELKREDQEARIRTRLADLKARLD